MGLSLPPHSDPRCLWIPEIFRAPLAPSQEVQLLPDQTCPPLPGGGYRSPPFPTSHSDICRHSSAGGTITICVPGIFAEAYLSLCGVLMGDSR